MDYVIVEVLGVDSVVARVDLDAGNIKRILESKGIDHAKR